MQPQKVALTRNLFQVEEEKDQDTTCCGLKRGKIKPEKILIFSESGGNGAPVDLVERYRQKRPFAEREGPVAQLDRATAFK